MSPDSCIVANDVCLSIVYFLRMRNKMRNDSFKNRKIE